MYISKTHNFAYFAVPRVASNSVHHVLENSGISTTSDDTIYNLDWMLSNPINTSNLLVENSGEVVTLDNYHMSPTEAINRGFVTADELREYNSFAFVRDPLERWVSRFMLAKSFGLWEGDNIDTMILAIRHGLMHGISDDKLSFKWDYKNYFYHNDEMLVTPYRVESVDEILTNVVTDAGGFPVSTPAIQLGEGTPPELKEPIESWLPSDCVDLLRIFYRSDIEFYESI